MKTPTKDLVRWGAYLARLSQPPREFKITRSMGGNQDQECARRRLFHERHRTAIGGADMAWLT
jgi:hypothetical protein